MNTTCTAVAVALAATTQAAAAEDVDPPDKARIAIVGDADRLNVGQAGYCGKRTELDYPSDMSFLVPADTKTWFYIRSKFRTPTGTYTCEGDFSFKPVSGRLHIIRFTFPSEKCTLELFQAIPGSQPVPIGADREPPQVCIGN
jgi:hypothetical protein